MKGWPIIGQGLAGPSLRFGSMDDHNFRLPHACFLQGWAPRISLPWDSWNADGVEDHVPRTLALGSIVPILDQERQGWGSLCRGKMGQV